MGYIISHDQIDHGYTFEQYLELVERLIEKNQTTGPDQSGEKVEMTRLNYQRVKRILKTCRIPDDLKDKIQHVSNET